MIKGVVSFRFSQGLLTLMCNNLKSKAQILTFCYIVWVKLPFFIISDSTPKLYYLFQIFFSPAVLKYFHNKKRLGSIYAIAFELNLVKVDLYGKK